MSDLTALRVLARGDHRDGYMGVLQIDDYQLVYEVTCGHIHSKTDEARDCMRRTVLRLITAGETAQPPQRR